MKTIIIIQIAVITNYLKFLFIIQLSSIIIIYKQFCVTNCNKQKTNLNIHEPI